MHLNTPTIEKFKEGILRGDRALLAKAITLIESTKIEDYQIAEKLLAAIYPHAGNSLRIGISGVPGVGKSTFIEAIGTIFIEQGKKVAVLAIDPSSKRTGGSILGDKTRMANLSKSNAAFIRPSAAQDVLGGVAYKTHESMLLCEAAGYDIILIETVGVGQSETEVSELTDIFLVLLLAGMGDELQALKKGIMEFADLFVFNKNDGTNKQATEEALEKLRSALPYTTSLQAPPIVTSCSAIENKGIDALVEMLLNHYKSSKASGEFDKKRKAQTGKLLEKELKRMVFLDFIQNQDVQKNIKKIENEVAAGKLSPTSGALRLLENYKRKK